MLNTGYGNVCPSSELGKLLLIAYGIVGMPLALVTMADTGKFLSRFVTICFNEKFRAVFVHLGLVVTCVAYIVLGAYLFQTIERPIELDQKGLEEFFSNISERGDNVEQTVDAYIENMLLLFENPHYAHVFETHFTNQTLDKDIWTFPASVLFTTTTIIPVGYV
ncbi:hypothetical protein OSTOST_09721 [Ostertagia ostertagi]